MAVSKSGKSFDPNDILKQSKELSKSFKNIANKVEQALNIGIEAACIFVEGEARKGADSEKAVDTGLYRNSFSHTQIKKIGLTTGYVGTNVEYATFIEFGTGIYNPEGRKTPWFAPLPEGGGFITSGMRPRPILTNALNNNINTVEKLISGEIGRVIK